MASAVCPAGGTQRAAQHLPFDTVGGVSDPRIEFSASLHIDNLQCCLTGLSATSPLSATYPAGGIKCQCYPVVLTPECLKT